MASSGVRSTESFQPSMATLPALVSTLKTKASSPRVFFNSSANSRRMSLWRGGGAGFGCAEEAGAVDDSFGAGFEEDSSVFGGFEAAAYLAGQAFADHLDEAAVVALAHGGV